MDKNEENQKIFVEKFDNINIASNLKNFIIK